ncbi:hypothetical protein G6F32_017445 [Rhizopus arrhizus]|nr:hypothetical protein G6F32_017445 [Rhizopus arrhizus]
MTGPNAWSASAGGSAMRVANAATVGWANRAPRPRSQRQRCSMASSRCTDDSESPPRLKKSASTATGASRPNA